MSSDTSDIAEEKPMHKVCVDGFFIGKYEVTQGLWQAVVGSNPSRFPLGLDYPVENVSWEDTQDFLKKLNAKTGKKYRLPTEAEWEYACRSGGRDEEFCGGNNLDELGWYVDNASDMHRKVGTKKPNGLGIYDMSGNVEEWVQERFDSEFHVPSPKNNPADPGSGETRVLRGGDWSCSFDNARSRFQREVGVDTSTKQIGFRIVYQE